MKNLKTLRKEFNMSQQELADILSVTQQTVYKYENSHAEPSLSTLIKLADLFHTTIDYLIDRPEAELVVHQPKLTNPEIKHLELYRKLDQANQKTIDELIVAINKNK